MRLQILVCAALMSGSLIACTEAHHSESPNYQTPMQTTGDVLVEELDGMGTPLKTWSPEIFRLFILRLQRIEALAARGDIQVFPGFIERERRQLAEARPDLPNVVKAPSETSVDGVTERNMQGQLAIMDHGEEKPEDTLEKPNRLRQAMQMIVAYNRPCQVLAERAHDNPNHATELSYALGCYEQIEPFIDDQVKLAQDVGDQEALKLLNAELSEINQYRTRLAHLRGTSASN